MSKAPRKKKESISIKNQAQDASQMSLCQDEPLYIVEQILETKIVNRKKFYLVKWQGWPVSSSTWQPYKNIRHLGIMIKQFKTQQFIKTRKQNNPISKGMNQPPPLPFPQLQPHGHFLLGDIPKKILRVAVAESVIKKSVNVEIEWEKRNNGVLPLPTEFSIEEVCEYQPVFLFGFLEKHIKLPNSNPGKGLVVSEEEMGSKESKGISCQVLSQMKSILYPSVLARDLAEMESEEEESGQEEDGSDDPSKQLEKRSERSDDEQQEQNLEQRQRAHNRSAKRGRGAKRGRDMKHQSRN